jgi:hypothetical protein
LYHDDGSPQVKLSHELAFDHLAQMVSFTAPLYENRNPDFPNNFLTSALTSSNVMSFQLLICQCAHHVPW